MIREGFLFKIMEEKMIYKAMLSIMQDVDVIKKEKRNKDQGFMFRGIDDMMNSLHGLFAKHGVFIVPIVESFDVKERPTKSNSVIYLTHAVITFNFTAQDGSFISIKNVGEAMDSGDKGMNKAMSIALKYALMQVFLIPTEDIADPDAEVAEETKDTNIEIALADIANAKSKEELLSVWHKWAREYGQQGTDFYNKWVLKQREFTK